MLKRRDMPVSLVSPGVGPRSDDTRTCGCTEFEIAARLPGMMFPLIRFWFAANATGPKARETRKRAVVRPVRTRGEEMRGMDGSCTGRDSRRMEPFRDGPCLEPWDGRSPLAAYKLRPAGEEKVAACAVCP